MSSRLLSPAELEAALRQIGAERYHSLHPFHKLMYQGKLTRGQLQAWALNRYYYQCRIPAKDATLIARLPTPELRRAWRRRLDDHDGDAPNTGGIARWLRLTDGLGLDRDYVVSTEGLLPITRFAVDAYVAIVRDRSILEAIGSCLTELFSPDIIAERVPGMLANYDFITADTLGYFHLPPGCIRRRSIRNSPLITSRSTRERPSSRRPFRRGAARQVRHSLGHAGRAAPCLRRAENDSSRRIRSGGQVSEAAIPAFPAGVKFRFDARRDAWIVLAPERLFLPDDAAVAILQLVDGTRSLGTIIDELATRFDAPRSM